MNIFNICPRGFSHSIAQQWACSYHLCVDHMTKSCLLGCIQLESLSIYQEAFQALPVSKLNILHNMRYFCIPLSLIIKLFNDLPRDFTVYAASLVFMDSGYQTIMVLCSRQYCFEHLYALLILTNLVCQEMVQGETCMKTKRHIDSDSVWRHTELTVRSLASVKFHMCHCPINTLLIYFNTSFISLLFYCFQYMIQLPSTLFNL